MIVKSILLSLLFCLIKYRQVKHLTQEYVLQENYNHTENAGHIESHMGLMPHEILQLLAVQGLHYCDIKIIVNYVPGKADKHKLFKGKFKLNFVIFRIMCCLIIS